MNIEHEIKLLIEQMQKLGKPNADGKYTVKYGVLFEHTAQIFETLMGTLKAAKKRKIVTFEGELLLQGVHNNVDIILLQDHL